MQIALITHGARHTRATKTTPEPIGFSALLAAANSASLPRPSSRGARYSPWGTSTSCHSPATHIVNGFPEVVKLFFFFSFLLYFGYSSMYVLKGYFLRVLVMDFLENEGGKIVFKMGFNSVARTLTLHEKRSLASRKLMIINAACVVDIMLVIVISIAITTACVTIINIRSIFYNLYRYYYIFWERCF